MSSLLTFGAPHLTRPWAVASLGLRLPLAAFFLWLAYKSLSADPKLLADFQRWGYGGGFLRAVGAAQALGGLALLLPQTAFAGALLLGGVLLGAIYTHARFDPLATALTPAAFLAAITAIALLHRPHGWF
jgi:putative oxidoreductase